MGLNTECAKVQNTIIQQMPRLRILQGPAHLNTLLKKILNKANLILQLLNVGHYTINEIKYGIK